MKLEITKDEVNDLEISKFQGRIVVVEKNEDVDAAVREVTRARVVGVDTETRPSFKKGRTNKVALLQIAVTDKVFIFKIKKVGVPAGIRGIIENDAIIKVGAALKDDLRELKEFGDFNERSVIDLNEYCRELGYKNFGVRNLAAMILGVRISKSQQTSNWEARELTRSQLVYAATDAWVCREMYLKMKLECRDAG